MGSPDESERDRAEREESARNGRLRAHAGHDAIGGEAAERRTGEQETAVELTVAASKVSHSGPLFWLVYFLLSPAHLLYAKSPVAGLFAWRRRESNPGPVTFQCRLLRA